MNRNNTEVNEIKIIETILISEEKYRMLFENLQEGIWVIDKDGYSVFVNHSMANMLGCSIHEIKGRNIFSFMNKEDVNKIRYFLEHCQDSIKEEHEFIFLQKDGREIYTLLDTTPIKDESENYLGYIVGVIDITERKRSNEERKKIEAQLCQMQKMEAIGTLAGGIAHDFNNILTAIVGYAELAQLEVLEGSSAWYFLEHVLKATNRAKDLIKQILTFSRQGNEEKRPIQLRSIIKEVLKLIRATLPTTIEIRQNLSAQSDTILGNPTQIHQVLMNLCSNAAYAMRDTTGVLEVRLDDVEFNPEDLAYWSDLTPGTYLRLTVSDTGCGIDPAIIDRIFDPFFTTKGREDGTGMGLAVVHGIVKSHGGKIKVYSELGKGSSFHIYIPKIEMEEIPDRRVFKPIPKGSECILFVDDEVDLAKLGEEMLKNLGYDVVARTSSIEALEAFCAQPLKFDLVITDQTMPNMTGLTLAKELINVRSDIPIILCTGFSETITLDKVKSIGIQELLMKPFVIHELAETIRNALMEKREERLQRRKTG